MQSARLEPKDSASCNDLDMSRHSMSIRGYQVRSVQGLLLCLVYVHLTFAILDTSTASSNTFREPHSLSPMSISAHK